MGDVQFEEDNNSYAPRGGFATQTYSGLTGLIIKTGVATDEKQARKVFLLLITTFFILAVIIYIINLPPKRDTSFEEKYRPGSSAVQQ